MYTIGEYVSSARTIDGDLTITLSINDDRELIERLEKSKGDELTIDISKYYEKRSLNANKYFWKLCDLIARALGSDKDTIYLLQLRKYGVFVDLYVKKDAVQALIDMDSFRYIEELTDGYDTEMIIARCYFGSSHYDKMEMSHLINGTVQDAKDLGISTWTQEEIDRLITDWKNNE